MLTRFMTLALLLAVACTPNPVRNSAPPQEVSEKATPVPSLVVTRETEEASGVAPTPASIPEDKTQKKLAQLAIDDLAARLNVGVEEISVISSKSTLWPDAALGCPTDKVYPPEKVPGFQIHLLANKRIYAYHTDRTSQVILCTGTEPREPGLR